MTRIIIHAGFHKTATSSLQEFLHRNREALGPYLAYYGKDDFPSVGTSARLYGQRRFPWRRLQFRLALRRFLAGIPNHATLVLSRETFAGVMPGHRDVFRRLISGYTRTAIPLAQEIIGEVRRRFGPQADIRFLYTTRAPDTWIRSVYGHLLRSIHLRDDFTTFVAGFHSLPDPQADAQTIATALAPVPVFIARLEDFTDHPEGPAAAILDMVEIPEQLRATLKPVPPQNLGQNPEIEQQFLDLNRSGQNKAALKSLKDRILKTGNTT